MTAVEEACPYIIILGTKVLPEGIPSKLLRERVEAGVALMVNWHPKATLVLSGKGSGPVTEAQCMANLAHELLADTQCSEPEIILEQNSMNTAGNAKECSVLLGHDRDRQVIVVTHKTHMPRAMRLFQREFGKPVEAHGVPHGKLWEALWCWLYECLALVKAGNR